MFKFGRLQEIGLDAFLTALSAKRHRKVSLAYALRSDECQILLFVQGRKRIDVFELLNIFAMQPGEIKSFKGFRFLQGKP